MMVSAVRFIEAWVLPPGGLVMLGAVGLLALRWRRRLGVGLIAAALVLLYLLSTPLVSNGLIGLLQTYPAIDAAKLRDYPARAIVVLSAGRNTAAPEFGYHDSVSRVTLERLRYGVWLHRRTGLPLLVSGGSPFNEQESLAALMARSLAQDFLIADVWQESASRTTRENALFSRQLLEQKGIDTVFLVSHAWHLPRAVAAFEAAGLHVIAAPTAFEHPDYGPLALAPNARSMQRSHWALHEMVGALWYWLERQTREGPA